MATYNPQRDEATSAIRNTMFRSGVVGNALQKQFKTITEKEIVDMLDSQVKQLADNNTVLSSIDGIATRISKNIFAIAKLMQKIYETNVKLKMLRDREASRQLAKAEETRFESPTYSATEDINEERTTSKKKNKDGMSYVTILRNIAVVGSVTALSFKKEIESFAEKATKWIEENITEAKQTVEGLLKQARDFVDQAVDSYIENSNQEVKDNEEQDSEMENLAQEITKELEKEDEEINDLLETDTEERDVTDVVPQELQDSSLVEQPSITNTELDESINDIEKDTLESDTLLTAPSSEISIKPDVLEQEYGAPTPMTLTGQQIEQQVSSANTQATLQSAAYENVGRISETGMAGVPTVSTSLPEQITTPLRQAVQGLTAPMSSQLMSRITTPQNFSSYKPSLIESTGLSRELLSPQSMSRIPTTTGISTVAPDRESMQPVTTTDGSMIGKASFDNRIGRIIQSLPSSTGNTVIMSNSSVDGVRPEMEHNVPSPIANRGSLEIGVRFRATD